MAAYGAQDIFDELLANEEVLQNDRKLSIIQFMLEAFATTIHLSEGDIFAYRDYALLKVPQMITEVEEQHPMHPIDLPKCNDRAAKARQEGNTLYQQKNFTKALQKYNESICYAPSESENLAIGYANRSAVYCEIEHYEFALANIVLAKKHNYPERLMAKLETRELNCKSKIEAAAEQRNSRNSPRLDLNVEVNAKIPFLAKGIAMRELPRFGRSMVAEKEFKVGNVILSESPTVTSTMPEARYMKCQYCLSENFVSLIPCSQCTAVMYCDEDCLKKGWRTIHRFECGIYDKLATLPYDTSHVAPKMFFYGLGLFNDDVDEMMKYCKAHGRTGSNPFDLDYTQGEDPLAAFKLLHTAKAQPRRPDMEKAYRCVVAIMYAIYIRQPLVQSLFVSQAQKDFLLEYIYEYSIVANRLSIAWEPHCVKVLYSIASICNHSCDPNTHAVYRAGQLRVVVVRPIRKGEQICISYVPIYGEDSDSERCEQLSLLEIDCACEVCDPDSFQQRLATESNIVPPPAYHKNFQTMITLMRNRTCTQRDKVNAVQQFIQRYAYLHPHYERFDETLNLYRTVLTRLFDDQMHTAMRNRALASLN